MDLFNCLTDYTLGTSGPYLNLFVYIYADLSTYLYKYMLNQIQINLYTCTLIYARSRAWQLSYI